MATLSKLTVLSMALASARAGLLETPTPQMGWNSYNFYNCQINQSIIVENAQSLVDTGLAKLGYVYVTPDCGWMSNKRDDAGRLQWDPVLFPMGGKALGELVHGLGLKLGLYSGAGYFQCGSTDLPASLHHETTDAATFVEWGADSLKYDNCYSISPTNMVDYTSPGAVSPDRFQVMADALNTHERPVLLQICQWGCGTDLGIWAAKMGNSYRISNDIWNGWSSIWRIANQVVPYFKHTGPGAWPDMDMLLIGMKVLSLEEEKFHFGIWAINKSPLTLGGPVIPSHTTPESLAVISNEEVIALNQDPLGKQAQLVRRYTEEEWDVWAGELSGGRLVLGLANWRNDTQTVKVDLDSVLGISSANARDVWAHKDVGPISGTYTTALAGHELRLLVLSDLARSTTMHQSAGYYLASDAKLGGSSVVVNCGSGQCLPKQTKVGNIQAGATVAFSGVSAVTAGTKLVGVDFINYDVALSTAWTDGTNTRNMTVSVNGGKAKRWAFPLSGGNWFETGRMTVEVDNFEAGKDNTVVFEGFGKGWAPDLVGFEVFE